MIFDATINLGQLLTIAPIIVGGAIVFGSLRQILKDQGSRIANIETEMKQQTGILIAIGRQEQRLDENDRRLNALERRP